MVELVLIAWAVGVPVAIAWQMYQLHLAKRELRDLEDSFRLYKLREDLEDDADEETMALLEEVGESQADIIGRLQAAARIQIEVVESLHHKVDNLDKGLTWTKIEISNADQKAEDALLQANELSSLIGELSSALAKHQDTNTSYHISIGKKVSDIEKRLVPSD